MPQRKLQDSWCPADIQTKGVSNTSQKLKLACQGCKVRKDTFGKYLYFELEYCFTLLFSNIFMVMIPGD